MIFLTQVARGYLLLSAKHNRKEKTSQNGISPYFFD